MPVLTNSNKLNRRAKLIICLLSLALGLIMVAGALVWSENNNQQNVATVTTRQYTKEELAKYDGKDGRQCLVAVDGTVYLIEGSDLWKDGQHTSSEGQAYCGADLSEVLKRSPHGKTKLEQLEKIGTLNQ